MHEALEQQKISVSKAGINATLKSRCSLLGAANPKYGRFDQYEPISEQIDLEPALISRFDLIFTVTDTPDEEKDRNLAEHIITTNYAGELTTQREEMNQLEVSQGEIDEMTEQVDPEIDAELLRKYIAYAKQNCHPRMTEEARNAIRDFYVDLRSKGTDEDAAVPVTARKLEALVRLSEASARVRLSDTVEQSDAERVIEIVRSCLQDVGSTRDRRVRRGYRRGGHFEVPARPDQEPQTAHQRHRRGVRRRCTGRYRHGAGRRDRDGTVKGRTRDRQTQTERRGLRAEYGHAPNDVATDRPHRRGPESERTQASRDRRRVSGSERPTEPVEPPVESDTVRCGRRPLEVAYSEFVDVRHGRPNRYRRDVGDLRRGGLGQ